MGHSPIRLYIIRKRLINITASGYEEILVNVSFHIHLSFYVISLIVALMT